MLDELRKSLVSISCCIRDIKKRITTFDSMFDPLQEMVAADISQRSKRHSMHSPVSALNGLEHVLMHS